MIPSTRPAPPPRERLVDARYREPLDVAARPRRAPLSGALQPGVPPRLRRDAAPVPPDPPAGAGGGAAAQHRPAVADICFAVGLRSVGSFTTSFGRTFGLSPTAYRATHPAGGHRALIPTCVLLAWARPQSSSFREDSGERLASVDHQSTSTGGKTCSRASPTSASGCTTRTRPSPSTLKARDGTP